jgi:hypothetical protein
MRLIAWLAGFDQLFGDLFLDGFWPTCWFRMNSVEPIMWAAGSKIRSFRPFLGSPDSWC